jgi:hypothetical protein
LVLFFDQVREFVQQENVVEEVSVVFRVGFFSSFLADNNYFEAFLFGSMTHF